MTFGEIQALLASHGYPGVNKILYSQPDDKRGVVDEELVNVVLETTCQYGPVILEFDESGRLCSVTVKTADAGEITVSFRDIVEVLRRDGYEYPHCTEILYTHDTDPMGNPEWSGRLVDTMCSYGLATLAFSERGALDSIEVC